MHPGVRGDVGLGPAERHPKQRSAPRIDTGDRGFEPEIGTGLMHDPLELAVDRAERLATVRGDQATPTIPSPRVGGSGLCADAEGDQ